MDIKGVITGDIIGSTQIAPVNRELLLNTIRDITRDIERWSEVRLEIFRGDSFQMLINNPVKTLRIGILIRSGLLKNSPTNIKWDARIALGIGTIAFDKEQSVVESDGEAFQNSGREFDELGKSKRLTIKTPWKLMNEELKVSTAFADEIISGWTITQAEVMYLSILTGKTQKELALELNKSPQTFSKLMINAKAGLIESYLNRYEQSVTNKLKKRHGNQQLRPVF